MSDERDLAEAIHAAIISADSVKAALDTWHRYHADTDFYRMWAALSTAAATAIDAALARRQREAARTGPWDGSARKQQKEIIAQAIEASMFASHELPLSKALHDKYLLTAAHVLDALAAAEPTP